MERYYNQKHKNTAALSREMNWERGRQLTGKS